MSKRRGDPPSSSRKELRHGSCPATGVELGIGIISSGTGKFSVRDGVTSVSDWALVASSNLSVMSSSKVRTIVSSSSKTSESNSSVTSPIKVRTIKSSSSKTSEDVPSIV